MAQNISPCKKVIERLKLFEWLIKFLQVQLKIGDELGAARREGERERMKRRQERKERVRE